MPFICPYLGRTYSFQPVSFRPDAGGISSELRALGLVDDCLEYCGGGHRARECAPPWIIRRTINTRKRVQPSWHTGVGRVRCNRVEGWSSFLSSVARNPENSPQNTRSLLFALIWKNIRVEFGDEFYDYNLETLSSGKTLPNADIFLARKNIRFLPNYEAA